MSALAAKLGVKPDTRCLVVGPAPDRVVADLFEPQRRATARPYDVIVAFCPDLSALARHLDRLSPRLTPAGGLWLAWPKRSSGVVTDVSESAVRGQGLATGLVDNKVAAIDETWSGLRFVRRVTDR